MEELNDTKEFALTTSDNPFNPIEKFDEWYEYDEEKGYHTCSYLARIAKISPGLSDTYNDDIIETAIDEIVRENLIGIETAFKVNYVKVVNEQN